MAIAHPQAGAIASKMLLFDRRDTLHSAGDLMGVDGIPRNRGVWEVDRGQYDADIVIFGGCGGGVAYRREAWEQAGGFDERLFMYLEDVDLAWRLQLLGWQAVFAPKARLYHHLSATGGGTLASFYVGRNTLWVIAKDMPGPLICRHFGRIVRAQARVTWDALRAWRGASARARLRGQFAGLIGLPRALRWRREVQGMR
jgi:GT2 family glycosyltransferase